MLNQLRPPVDLRPPNARKTPPDTVAAGVPARLQAREKTMEDVLVEDDKEKCVGPSLAGVTYALHVHDDWMIKGFAAVLTAVNVTAAKGDEESDIPPHPE